MHFPTFSPWYFHQTCLMWNLWMMNTGRDSTRRRLWWMRRTKHDLMHGKWEAVAGFCTAEKSVAYEAITRSLTHLSRQRLSSVIQNDTLLCILMVLFVSRVLSHSRLLPLSDECEARQPRMRNTWLWWWWRLMTVPSNTDVRRNLFADCKSEN